MRPSQTILNDESPLVEAKGFGWFLADQQRWLWRGINLSLHVGDRLSLAGHSGAGKTLLLRSMALLLPVTEGSVRWRGHEVPPTEYPRYRSQICYVPQRAVMIEGTVRDNLLLPFEFKCNAHRRPNEGYWEEWLTGFGRDASFLRRSADELSGGEAQIVALLRVLQLEPEVLLVDEPTSDMDPESAIAAEGMIIAWSERHRGAFVWISHDQRQAKRIANRRLQLQDGQLMEEISHEG